MVEKTVKPKKGSISEDDIPTIFNRYTATTVLTLLQEIAQASNVKFDWDALVNKTTTGISSAREYQMLWRHLAYRDALLERLDDGAQPLDDDSDLEYELEAFPTVTTEASTEAAAFVKVLIASGLPSDSSLPNGSTIEAPLTINIPNGHTTKATSEIMQGTNITVPVSVKKQPLPTVTTAEGLDANGTGSGNLPPRRKRKPWSETEDMELIAAVQKCGEGNWANILKGDFKGDRTASQLSQRWAIIRKRQGNLGVGGGSLLSENQLATRRAVSLALNMPIADNLKAACAIAGGTNPAVAEASSVDVQSQHPSQLDSVATVPQRSGILGSSSKFRLTSKKPSTKSALSPDALVKAAAVAAGARIATASDAASLLKAAQAKNAVHIMPGGSLIKPSMAGNANPLPIAHFGPHPNVHYIRTGLASTPLSTYSSVPPNTSRSAASHQVQGHIVKPAVPIVQTNLSNTAPTAPESNASPEATKIIYNENELEVNTAEDIVICSSDNAPKEQGDVSGNAPREQVPEDQAAFSGNPPSVETLEGQGTLLANEPKEQLQASVSVNAMGEIVREDQDQVLVLVDASNEQVRDDQSALPSSETIPSSQIDFVANSKCSLSAETAGNDRTVVNGNLPTNTSKHMNDDNQSADMEICEN